MQKALIVLMVGLLSVGCGNSAEKKVLGEYEYKDEDGDTLKQVLLDNGIYEHHFNGEKQLEGKWSISNGKIHIDYDNGYISVIRINEDKSITQIAEIVDGKRRDHPKEGHAFKKIK